MRAIFRTACLVAWLAIACAWPAAAGEAPPGEGDIEFFEKRVRPVLVEHCQKCHGDRKQEAGLRLDSREAALRGGDSGPAVERDRPEQSLLIEAIGYAGDLRMPPKGKLDDEAIAALTDWVRRGAPWPNESPASTSAEFDLDARKARQWAFQPIRPGPLPAVRAADWPATSVDQFLLAALEAQGLSPAPPADRRTLLRRVTFDLVGLPPAADELKEFLHDDSPEALDRVVDRLLASPHYGERWGRHWLDLVRYAETAGHEFDFEIPYAGEYRDYVVRAWNADLPYDQFVMEHVAGDLLPEPRWHAGERFNESIIATGFWFLGESKHSPVDVRADEADRMDNQLDVFGKAFLGQTLGCARCHDHKFDALSTRDYYALKGYLQSSRRVVTGIDDPADRRQVVDELARLRDERAQAVRGAAPAPVSAERPLAERDVTFVDFSRDGFDGWFVDGDAFGTAPVRDPAAVFGLPGLGWPAGAAGLAHSGALSARLEGALRSPTFTISRDYILYLAAGHASEIHLIVDSLHYLQNPIYGGLRIPLSETQTLRWHAQDVRKWIGHNAYIELVDPGAGALALERVVFSDRGTEPFAVAGGAPSPLPSELESRWTVLAESQAKLEDRLAGRRRALVMNDGTPEDERVHVRGNAHRFGEPVPRRFLEAIAGADQPAPAHGSGRLELARRLIDRTNPLLARVIVNRLWKHHFGEGLVRTPDDFGNMGQPPTHPELLDWLAALLSGQPDNQSPSAGHAVRGRPHWSLKRLHRELLLSSAYRMASRDADPRGDEIDPTNRLWHRMNLRRLEAEAIRDAVLMVSGRLDRTVGGPSVLPYLTPFMVGRGRPASSGPLDGNGRRSLYLSVRRNFLTPLFLAFDAPVPFSTVGRRSVSNVPAQALALMNNPFVLEQSRVWGDQALRDHADPSARLAAMYLAAFAREPTSSERTSAEEFLRLADGGPEEASRRWADLAHVLFNVKEFVLIE